MQNMWLLQFTDMYDDISGMYNIKRFYFPPVLHHFKPRSSFW